LTAVYENKELKNTDPVVLQKSVSIAVENDMRLPVVYHGDPAEGQ
jgi:hypothetical protein